ncbi:hypothetical protein R6Q57_026126 [Mikania cordata]
MDHRTLDIAHVIRARQLQLINLICLLVALIIRFRLSKMNHTNLPTKDEILQQRLVREEMLDDLSKSEYTGDEIFKKLEMMSLESYEVPRALNFLATNQGKARTLFSCPLQIRMGVLQLSNYKRW